MFEIVIISHGPLADAMKESLMYFFSEVQSIFTVAIDRDGLEKFQKNMDETFAQIDNKDVLIFTDLLYGTPFNEAGKRVNRLTKDFEILSGVNMPILLEAVNMQKQGKNLKETLSSLEKIGIVQSFKSRLEGMEEAEADE